MSSLLNRTLCAAHIPFFCAFTLERINWFWKMQHFMGSLVFHMLNRDGFLGFLKLSSVQKRLLNGLWPDAKSVQYSFWAWDLSELIYCQLMKSVIYLKLNTFTCFVMVLSILIIKWSFFHPILELAILILPAIFVLLLFQVGAYCCHCNMMTLFGYKSFSCSHISSLLMSIEHLSSVRHFCFWSLFLKKNFMLIWQVCYGKLL